MKDLDDLILAARAARERAYAPYSNYRVGAAVRGDNGKIYGGCNVENASYGLCVCAERTAVVSAVLDGVRRLTGVAVMTASDPPAAPCGMCRQTLNEFADGALPIALVNDAGARSDTTLGALLPQAFGPGDLKK